MSNKINEVSGVIISRALLDEYGYDGDMPSDEEMQTIADELWSIGARAMAFVMPCVAQCRTFMA